MNQFDTIFAIEKYEVNIRKRIAFFIRQHQFFIGFLTGFFTLAIYNIIVRALA